MFILVALMFFYQDIFFNAPAVAGRLIAAGEDILFGEGTRGYPGPLSFLFSAFLFPALCTYRYMNF